MSDSKTALNRVHFNDYDDYLDRPFARALGCTTDSLLEGVDG